MLQPAGWQFDLVRQHNDAWQDSYLSLCLFYTQVFLLLHNVLLFCKRAIFAQSSDYLTFLCFDPVPWGSDKVFYCILCGPWSLGGAIHWFFWSKTGYKPKGIVIKSITYKSFFQKKTFVVFFVTLKTWFCAELSKKKSKHCK